MTKILSFTTAFVLVLSLYCPFISSIVTNSSSCWILVSIDKGPSDPPDICHVRFICYKLLFNCLTHMSFKVKVTFRLNNFLRNSYVFRRWKRKLYIYGSYDYYKCTRITYKDVYCKCTKYNSCLLYVFLSEMTSRL